MTTEENLQNVADVFQIFHDGIITGFEGDDSLLRLTIECQYLAEIINPEFELFYIELSEVTKFDLYAWQNPIDLSPFILHGYEEALKAELEIGYSDVVEGQVKVSCHQHDINYDYSGGNLLISCSDIKVYDHGLRELTVDELDAICSSYWNRARD